jgi:F-type H+-transporting ATPase subunit b
MFLKVDGTFLVQLANFALFFALLNVLFLRPVGKAIRERRKYIDAVSNDYANYQAQARALREEAERVRAQARREAEQTVAKSRADASNAAAELAARYSSQVQTTVEEAARNADEELAKARAGENRLVEQLAGAMVDRALEPAQ